MFFNQDILFRNGSLALVWKTGNGEFTTKRSRSSKEYRCILKCSLIVVCKDLRGLLPLMGTAHGLSLKNMATLVKGAGTIYAIKVEQLARDVYAATVQLKKPMSLLDPQISNTMPQPKKGTTKKNTVVTDNAKLPVGVAAGLTDAFGNLCGGFMADNGIENMFGSPRAIPSLSRLSEISSTPVHFPALRLDASPAKSVTGQNERSAQKRRRNENDEEIMYQNVLKKLRTELIANPRANCLLDDEGILPLQPPERDHPDLDFGDGMDIINNADQILNDGDAIQVPELPPRPDELPVPSPSVTSTLLGPPSRIELDTRGTILGTPVGARTTQLTQPINQRRIVGRQLETTFIELGDVDVEADRRKRLGTKAKKRLLFDQEITMPFSEMIARVKAEINMDTLMSQLEKSRAPGKYTWEIHRRGRGIDFIKLAGRTCPSAILRGMTNDILNNQSLHRGSRVEISGVNREAELAETAITAEGRSEATLQDVHVNRSRVPEAPILEFDEAPMIPVIDHEVIAPAVAENCLNEELMQTNDFGETGRRRVAVNGVQERLCSNLSDNLESTMFHTLYPPATTTRKNASLAFFTMLKMQAKKEIRLHQSEPYGPIAIERMNSSTQE